LTGWVRSRQWRRLFAAVFSLAFFFMFAVQIISAIDQNHGAV
jgi:hypothetical protein